MPKNSMLDNDFIEADDPFVDPHEEERAAFEDQEVNPLELKRVENDNDAEGAPDGTPDQDKFEVEIIDDTPEEDQGKWVADDERDGEPEEIDEEDVKKYSKNVQERLNKLTARTHAERRAKEDRERQLNEAVTMAQRLLAENNELKSIVEGGEKILNQEHVGRLEGELAKAKQAYRDASEAGDANGQIAAQEAIARSVTQIERAKTIQPQELPRTDEKIFEQFQTPQETAQPQVSDRARKWQEENQWFNTDVAMQSHALVTHKLITEQGVQVDSDEYYTAIDQEMRKRFPDRFQGEKPQRAEKSRRRQGATVAPASRDTGKVSRKVQMNESQVKVARRLGLTPEQYAEQLIKEERQGNGREFTHKPRR